MSRKSCPWRVSWTAGPAISSSRTPPGGPVTSRLARPNPVTRRQTGSARSGSAGGERVVGGVGSPAGPAC